MGDDYRPIACALHSELELAVMHRIRLRATHEGGLVEGIASDMGSEAGAEYLHLTDQAGNRHSLRLDRITRLVALPKGRRIL